MNNLPAGYTLQRPTRDDAPLVHQLLLAYDVAVYGEEDSDINDLLDDWSGMDLNKDAWLLFAADGRLVGYTGIEDRKQNHFYLDYFTHPTLPTDELDRFLVALGEERIREMAAAMPGRIVTIIPSTAERDIRVLSAAGYEVGKHYFRMLLEMEDAPPPPIWPPQLTIRNVIPGEDDQALFEFIQTAFDWPGREANNTLEAWRGFMMRPDHFISELWFLIHHEDQLIGAALCYDYIDYGWVRQLAVRKDWRGRGLGATILRYVFGVFYERGRDQVALGVEANNTDAIAFYERVGMKMVRRYDEYRKPIE